MALKQHEKREELKNDLSTKFNNRTVDIIQEGWGRIAEGLTEATPESVGFAVRKNRDWFDANLSGIQDLLNNKHKALTAYLSNPSSIHLKEEWRQMRGIAQRTFRSMEDSWWLIWWRRCKVSPILATFTPSTTH